MSRRQSADQGCPLHPLGANMLSVAIHVGKVPKANASGMGSSITARSSAACTARGVKAWFSAQFQTQCLGSLGPPGMLGQFAYPKHLHAGLSHGLVILDRASTRADGAHQHTVLIYDRQTSWEGD